MGVLDAIRAASGNPKVPEPVAASPGSTTSIEEVFAHPGPPALGDEPTPLARQALEYLCRIATQASTDDVIDSALYLLSQPVGSTGGGFVQLASTRDVGMVAVVNHGTSTIAVVAGQPAAGPAPQGQGQTLIAPGCLLAVPLGGSFHTIYGRFGEAVTVVRYASTRDPHGATLGDTSAFTPNVPNPAGGAGAVFYTAPFPGVIPAYLSDWTAANTGATLARFKFFDGSVATGLQLEDVEVPIGTTVDKSYDRPRALLTGVLTCLQVAGDAGTPKVSVGVQ